MTNLGVYRSMRLKLLPSKGKHGNHRTIFSYSQNIRTSLWVSTHAQSIAFAACRSISSGVDRRAHQSHAPKSGNPLDVGVTGYFPPSSWKPMSRLLHVRRFHDYFTTSIPNRSGSGDADAKTTVRIPLVSAKQHFGMLRSRGNRPYNEDWSQAGVLDLPISTLVETMSPIGKEKNPKPDPFLPSASPSSSVFYYAVFDGHGGEECSKFLKSKLHEYIESTAQQFYPQDSLSSESSQSAASETAAADGMSQEHRRKNLQAKLISEWRETVGGYFKRFKPNFTGPAFVSGPATSDIDGTSKGAVDEESTPRKGSAGGLGVATGDGSWESILTYSFLRADLDFITGKWNSQDAVAAQPEPAVPDKSSSGTDVPATQPNERAELRSKSGSTASVAIIFTPPSLNLPYWSPEATSTLITAHIGDTRIILSNAITGQASYLTSTHHPSHPLESRRLRRYAGAFVSDSFGEERFGVLANTRSFGDANQKRLGVTAEPEIVRRELKGSDWSFMVLCSDGVSGVLSDQEIVDIVKEAETPEEGAKAVVRFAEEVAGNDNGGADNCTCLVVRLGAWEQRDSGGVGSAGTKQEREWRRSQISRRQ